MNEAALTVDDVLGLIPGSLIQLSKGDTQITGRYNAMDAGGGLTTAPVLILDLSIWHAYNVTKLIEHGWTLTVLETP